VVRMTKNQSRSVESARASESFDVFGPIDRSFERMFDAFPTVMPFWRAMVNARHWLSDSFIRVDEFHKDGALVIQAELPGIDPTKDVDLTVSDGVLRITAERHEDDKVEESGYVRQELHRGSFERLLPLPDGVSESDVKATYKDGILEITIPTPEPKASTKVPVTVS
jgi:HSP20 family protein